jgi:hypothetical protein
VLRGVPPYACAALASGAGGGSAGGVGEGALACACGDARCVAERTVLEGLAAGAEAAAEAQAAAEGDWGDEEAGALAEAAMAALGESVRSPPRRAHPGGSGRRTVALSCSRPVPRFDPQRSKPKWSNGVTAARRGAQVPWAFHAPPRSVAELSQPPISRQEFEGGLRVRRVPPPPPVLTGHVSSLLPY